MKTYWGSGGAVHAFLTWTLDRGKWSASHSGCFITRVRIRGIYWTGVWVCPKVGLDAVEKRKNLIIAPRRELNSSHSAHILVSTLT